MAILGQAKVGKMRLGAHRLNFYQPNCYATVGGVRCETQLLEASLRIAKRANSAAAVQGTTNSAVFRMKTGSVTPAEGKDVKIYCGSTAPQSLLFGGTIQQLAQVYEGEKQANIFFDITAVGYGWLFNRRLIASKTYRRVSASTIILDLIATYASGVTTTHVDLNLPTISVSFTNTALADALNEIAQLVGSATTAARWFLDDTGTAGDLWFFTTDPRMAPETITGKSVTNPLSNIFKLVRTKDLAQVRTRVIARGGSTTTILALLGSGAPVVPIANAYPFALPSGVTTGGGELHLPLGSGERLVPITYTGTQRGSLVAAPTTAMLAGCGVRNYLSSGSNGVLSSSAYRWAFTFVTSNGETVPSDTLSGYQTSGIGQAALLDISGLLSTLTNAQLVPPDRSITAIRVYRTIANGTQLLLSKTVTSSGGATGWPSTVTDDTLDTSLGAAPPSVGTICPQGQSGSSSSTGASAGATAVNNVSDLTVFDPTGGYAVFGNVLIQYASVSYTGANASGTLNLVTALPTQLLSGVTVNAVPVLTGCVGTDALAPTTPVAHGALGSVAGPTIGTRYGWAATFVTAAGESLPSPVSAPLSKIAPPALITVTATNFGSGSGPTNTGVYSWILAYRNPQGMLSVLSAASGNLTSNGTAANVTWFYNGTEVTPAAADFYVFRTKANGSTYFLVPSIQNYNGALFQDISTDAALVTTMTAFWLQKYTLVNLPLGPSTVTARKLYRNLGPGTALKLVTTVSDNTTTSVDDTVTDAALGAAPPTTDTAGALGVPAIPPNTTLGLYFQADDTAAQSALATLEGGSGIHEAAVSDSSYTTIDTVIAAAQASLALNKTAEASIDLDTRDYKMQPGISFTITIGSPTNISGTFRASEITITQIAAKVTGPPYLYPRIAARGSTMRWSLADFLWHMKLAADQKL